MRLALLTTLALALLCATAPTALARPDLRVLRVSVSSGGASTVLPGGALRVRDRIANRGRHTARRSTARYYLSRDWRRSRGDVRVGSRSVRALRRRAQSRAARTFAVPRAGVEGYYRLIACADARRRVRESSERNNCRVAAQPVRVVPDRDAPSIAIDRPSHGNATFDTTPQVSGRAGTGSGDSLQVTVRIYGGAAASGDPVATLTVERDAAGRWGAEPASALPRGTYTARAEQTDAAGNVALSDPVTFAIGPATLLAAGDIASCSSGNDEATAALLRARPAATIAVLGDAVYENGTVDEYNRCYAPNWGRPGEKSRTRPTPGNHDYQTSGASGYFDWFGAAAGERGKGYYSYDLGSWHVVVLNSNCSDVGGCHSGSAQERWLAADLAAHPARCTVAYWHHPLFSSDPRGGHTSVRPLWNRLYAARAELVLNGHAHQYERFTPKRPDGTADAANGIREFVAGMGGRSLNPFASSPAAGSERRDNGAYGVLRLTLDADSYAWQFVPTGGGSPRDSGSQRCH